MKTSVEDDGGFVRSLSSRGDFGGLAPEVWPMALAMLAAFEIVIVETVGVGQREIDVAATCDTTCFVAQPGSGDSIQFLKAGVVVAAGSDFPVEPANPFFGLHAAVARADADGRPPGGWRADEAMSMEEALCAFTRDAAFASFDEARLGRPPENVLELMA